MIIVKKYKSRCLLRNKNAFTLIELSIVIVIIGLIIAGVTAGSNLVKLGKLRAQVTELQMYYSAYQAFRIQYNAVPGDMINASSYWPGANNGDGDGRISFDEDHADTNIENLTLFEHLSMAKLIPYSFNASSHLINIGYPSLKIDKRKGMVAAGFLRTNSYQVTSKTGGLYKAELVLNVGATNIVNSGYNDFVAMMTPFDAQSIDIKIDDGKARAGLFKGFTSYAPATWGNCLTGSDGDYLITNSNIACNAEYILQK